MPGPVVVDFFFSPTSRYSYLASTRILGLQLETRCRADWHPLHLPDLQAAHGVDMFAHGRLASGQYDPGWRRRDAEDWAALYGVPFREPADVVVPDPRRMVLACVVARLHDAGQNYARRLMQAAFVEGLSPIDDAALGRLGEEAGGIPAADFVAALDAPETEAAHRATLDRALAAGCFGVPSFVVGGRMFWGNDRLPLVRAALARAQG
jgi:2-hydroxychromene-2-carboxylate isomerase